jgi:hypothetical protein
MWAEILEKCIAALVAVAAVTVPALAVQLARYLAGLAKVKLTEAQQKQLEFAAQKGVAFAAEKLRGTVGAGNVKATVALQQARSLAPEAFSKLDESTQAAVIQATYATMRASLPHESTHATPGSDIPVDVVLPKPSPLPAFDSTRATPLPRKGPKP